MDEVLNGNNGSRGKNVIDDQIIKDLFEYLIEILLGHLLKIAGFFVVKKVFQIIVHLFWLAFFYRIKWRVLVEEDVSCSHFITIIFHELVRKNDTKVEHEFDGTLHVDVFPVNFPFVWIWVEFLSDDLRQQLSFFLHWASA